MAGDINGKRDDAYDNGFHVSINRRDFLFHGLFRRTKRQVQKKLQIDLTNLVRCCIIYMRDELPHQIETDISLSAVRSTVQAVVVHLTSKRRKSPKDMSWCPDCKDYRPLSEFNKCSSMRLGVQSYCRKHRNLRRKDYKSESSEHRRQKRREL